jgi:hypothetical protein
MKKFEYIATVPIPTRLTGDLIPWLNTMGDGGWEFCFISPKGAWVFKRVLQTKGNGELEGKKNVQ